ncbi:MAG: hypothetical protein F9K46_17565, partial [Anaerolineae bacterium]
MFKKNDWVIYTHDWPFWASGKPFIVEGVRLGGAVYDLAQDNGKSLEAFHIDVRPHLDGDPSPYDTEILYSYPYGDGYNEQLIERCVTRSAGWQPCEHCNGIGWTPSHAGPTDCPQCDGVGYFYHADYDLHVTTQECQHEAQLDAVEDEADLKAYRAEHGDDAPDPIESAPRERYYQIAAFERAELQSANIALHAQLAAVTAERDRYKAQYEHLHALRKQIWDMVMQADSSHPLT